MLKIDKNNVMKIYFLFSNPNCKRDRNSWLRCFIVKIELILKKIMIIILIVIFKVNNIVNANKKLNNFSY